MTKSAYLPGVSEPIVRSWNAANAGHMVMDFSASSLVIFSAGNQPPGGQSLSSARAIAAWNEYRGFTRSTGKSLPFGMITPVLSSERQAYAPNDRAYPSRVGAQFMSLD